ncbi:MAG TPA: RpiB/LacA/LacB family sugar-phosphate isomerase [Patescibacteria group bacterium]
MRVYIGADHRGFHLKEKIAKWLFDERYKFEDVGASTFDPNDDYTKYAQQVASLVANDDNSQGILLCGSGVGVDAVANKFDGIRSSIGKTPKQVEAGRKDDDMNILVLAADFTKEVDAKKMVKAFLVTEFDNAKRHKKRLSDIKKIEANN